MQTKAMIKLAQWGVAYVLAIVLRLSQTLAPIKLYEDWRLVFRFSPVHFVNDRSKMGNGIRIVFFQFVYIAERLDSFRANFFCFFVTIAMGDDQMYSIALKWPRLSIGIIENLS